MHINNTYIYIIITNKINIHYRVVLLQKKETKQSINTGGAKNENQKPVSMHAVRAIFCASHSSTAQPEQDINKTSCNKQTNRTRLIITH